MRIVAGILMIIAAIVFAVIGLITITNNMDIYLVQPVRALPALLVLLIAFLLGFFGLRTFKRRK